jgi:hypothetical protein
MTGVSWITTRENSTRRKWGVVRVAGAIVGSSVLLGYVALGFKLEPKTDLVNAPENSFGRAHFGW